MKTFNKFIMSITIIISLVILLSIIIFPIKISDANVFIETPDINNPTEKVLTFKARAFNKLKFGTIDFKVSFDKQENKEIEHPYYDLIPEQFQENDTITIKPMESKKLTFSTKITTNDKRIINSIFNNVKASYKVVGWKTGDK